MSYQDFLRSTSNPERPSSATPSPVIHRKPPPTYATIPVNLSPGSVHKTVTQYNSLRSASLSGQGPLVSPVVTNGNEPRSYSPAPTASPAVVRSAASTDSRPTTQPQPQAASYPPPSVPPPPIPSAVPAVDSSGIQQPEPLRPVRASTPEQNRHLPPPAITNEWDTALQTCLALQTTASTQFGKRPFAALLLGPDRTTVLQTQFSLSHIQHAESELARSCYNQYPREFLRKCTLVSTWEPCAMCSGTIYWSGVGRLVYAASERRLKQVTGAGNLENLTLDVPCRVVFAGAQEEAKVEVVGPVLGWEDRVSDSVRSWWKIHEAGDNHGNGVGPGGVDSTLGGVGVGVQAGPGVGGQAYSNSVRSASASMTSSLAPLVTTNPQPDAGVSSRIGDDGEYKADLQVDWMM